MKIGVIVTRAFYAIALAVVAAMPTAADNRAGEALSADVIRKQIEYLASDELRGRGSGEPGNEKAARFIAEEFRRAGLKPIGTAAQRDAGARYARAAPADLRIKQGVQKPLPRVAYTRHRAG